MQEVQETLDSVGEGEHPEPIRTCIQRVLVWLDDSALQEELRTQQAALDLAKADWIAAEENCKIVALQNQGDIQQADPYDLSGLDLQKYAKGDYEQARVDLEERD